MMTDFVRGYTTMCGTRRRPASETSIKSLSAIPRWHLSTKRIKRIQSSSMRPKLGGAALVLMPGLLARQASTADGLPYLLAVPRIVLCAQVHYY